LSGIKIEWYVYMYFVWTRHTRVVGGGQSPHCLASVQLNESHHISIDNLGARWPRDQCAWRTIAEAKRRSQRSVIGWVTKVYYLELLRASVSTLSCWSQLPLQSLAPASISRRVDVRPIVKIFAESLTHHDENMLYRTHLVG
jgi:hypothetical protein